MSNAKKWTTDAVYNTKTEALAALAEAHQNAAATGLSIDDCWHITNDNLPLAADENGELSPVLAYDENGQPVILTDDKIGQLALVTIWKEGEGKPQPEGAPLAIPAAFYFLALPDFGEITSNEKLREIARKAINALQLKSARSMAKAHHADKDANPLARDRIAALIAAAQSRAGDPAAKAFKALFPVMQAAILKRVEAQVTNLKDGGRHADARLLAATYSRARLNAQTILDCLMSEDAAKRHFPAMAQTQWENLLKFAIAWAPKHQIAKLVKDEAGSSIMETDPATGKQRAKRENTPAPVSPVPFMAFLESRSERMITPQDAPALDFADMA